MSDARRLAAALIDEAVAARAHFQVWWALRNQALPRFLPTMNDLSYVDFFHASNAGHYKLFLLALSKIYDRHAQAGGMQSLREALTMEGRPALAVEIENRLRPYRGQIKCVDGIRDKSLVHNEKGVPRSEVYAIHGITPNDLRALIDATAQVLNHVAGELGISSVVFEGDRLQCATLAMLERLERGGT